VRREQKKNKQKSPSRFGDVLSKTGFSQQEKGIFEKSLRNFGDTHLTDLTM
jgi:hypothetical protein